MKHPWVPKYPLVLMEKAAQTLCVSHCAEVRDPPWKSR